MTQSPSQMVLFELTEYCLYSIEKELQKIKFRERS
ncbi:hypothetical protein [Photorhabdus temperata]|nr:hypothetical protein [Photorhabdus temperata]